MDVEHSSGTGRSSYPVVASSCAAVSRPAVGSCPPQGAAACGGASISSGCVSSLKVLSAAFCQKLLAASFLLGVGACMGLGVTAARWVAGEAGAWPGCLSASDMPVALPGLTAFLLVSSCAGSACACCLPEICGCSHSGRGPGSGQARWASAAFQQATEGQAGYRAARPRAAWPPAGCHSWCQLR